MPYSRASSPPGDQTCLPSVSCTTGRKNIFTVVLANQHVCCKYISRKTNYAGEGEIVQLFNQSYANQGIDISVIHIAYYQLHSPYNI